MSAEFFEQVWPEEGNGYYCVAELNPQGWFSHHVFDTKVEAITRATQLDVGRKDVYFSIGTLTQPKVFNEEKQKWQQRTHSNMNSYKCLIADLDAGEGKPYKDRVEALQALKTFIRNSGMPIPTLVASGNGLHVYWPFKESLPADKWHQLAARFKEVLKAEGLHADETRTADKSSVLRVPGTHNHKKNPPLDVTLLKLSEPTPVLQIITTVKALYKKHNLSAPKIFDPLKTNLFAGLPGNLEDTPKCLDKILANCKQMQHVREVGGPVGYAMRAAATSIIKFTSQKDYSITTANDPDPQKVNSQLQAFLKDSITDNPATCEKFKSLNPSSCEGCKHTVKSPIVLGFVVKSDDSHVEVERMQAATKPVEIIKQVILDEVDNYSEEEQENVLIDDDYVPAEKEVVEETWLYGTPRYELPDGYANSRGTIVYNPPAESDNPFPVTICEGIFYPFNIYKNLQGSNVVDCYYKMGCNVGDVFTVETAAIADKSSLMKVLASHGIMIRSGNAQKVGDYMSSYISKIQGIARDTLLNQQLGWRNEGVIDQYNHDDSDKVFVLPNKTISKNGTTQSAISPDLKSACREFGQRGSLEEWKKVINVYAQEGYESYAFGHLTGYGSLLMELTSYNGAVINMIGDSGSGKSTVLRTINSLFGKPDGFLTQRDTPNAFMNRIGSYGSIAITADELTNLDGERVSDILYAISQGRDKDRLSGESKLRVNNTSWRLLLAASSNKSLADSMQTYKADASAESMRLFEYRIDRIGHKITKQESEELFSPIENNYGHAGEIFLEYLVNNTETVKTLLKSITAKIDEATDIQVHERYWSAVAACNITGGMIAKSLGLNNFDMQAITNWVSKQIISMRETVVENKRNSNGTLQDYLNDTVGYTISIAGDGTKAKPFYSVTEPTQKLYNRVELDTNLLYIDRSRIKYFMNKSGSDYNAVRRELTASGVLLNSDRMATLSRGANVIRTGQVHCWVIDLKHEHMSGMGFIKAVVGDDKAKEA